MYNVVLGDIHPSTICVEISRLPDSLRDLLEVLISDYPAESMAEFIETYARTDKVMPDDKTLGFVVVNKNKKAVALSFSKIPDGIRENVLEICSKYRDKNFQVEVDIG
ncbi:TA0956 family protein [Oxyplasma meridianum]|uniref:TA0956 family protein n=1 Tax=Oxyplasma meridianum TaxID=3073602 RepID=A0AAX4NGN5_9ARCH